MYLHYINKKGKLKLVKEVEVRPRGRVLLNHIYIKKTKELKEQIENHNKGNIIKANVVPIAKKENNEEMNLNLIYNEADLQVLKTHYENQDYKGIKHILKKYRVIACSSCDYTLKQFLKFTGDFLKEKGIIE